MFKEVKTPTNNKWINSIKIINSLIKCFTDVQLISKQIGVNIAVNTIKGMDISSTPKWRGPHLKLIEVTSIQSLHKFIWNKELKE